MNTKRKSIDLSNDESQKKQSIENSTNNVNSQENGNNNNTAIDKADQEVITTSNDNNTQNQITTSNSSNNIKQSSVPVNRWSLDKTLEWLNRKAPNIYENYKQNFMANQITGDILLELNNDSLEELKIFDSSLREQLLDEIAILKIKNEYEFVKRFKSNDTKN